MLRYAFRTDSGGPGTWRGGAGVEREYVVEADDASLTLWFGTVEDAGLGASRRT